MLLLAISTKQSDRCHQLSAALPPSLCRPVQPQTFGVAHIAAVNILVVLGAFCAALLAASYNSQVVQWKVRSQKASVCVARR